MTPIEMFSQAAGALPWPLFIAGGLTAAAVVAATGFLTAKCTARVAHRLATAGLDRARAADHATGALAWGSKRLTVVIGGAGIAVASYGVVMFLRGVGLPWPLAVLGSAVIEGGILVLKLEGYRAIHAKGDHTPARNLAWLFIAASAWANFTHPPQGAERTGALIFGLFPILGAALIEFNAWTLRRDLRRRAVRGDAGELPRPGPVRMAAALWHRGWATASVRLGIQVEASDEHTDRALRAQRAARALYRLRLTAQREAVAGGRRKRRLARRIEHDRHRAQRALDLANVGTDRDQATRVAARVRAMVTAPDLALGDWSDVRVVANTVADLTALPDLVTSAVRDPGAVPLLRNGLDLSALSRELAPPTSAPQMAKTHGSSVVKMAEGASEYLAEARRATDRPGRDRVSGANSADTRRPSQPSDAEASPVAGRKPSAWSTPPRRKGQRNGRRNANRAEPDVSDLIPLGQELFREIREEDGTVTRARLVEAFRQRHGSLSNDRASALWRMLNNGRAPTVD